jgi:hypothetical protein
MSADDLSSFSRSEASLRTHLSLSLSLVLSLDLPRTTGFGGGLLTGLPSHSTVAIRPAEERENRILMLAVLGAEKPECLEPRYVPSPCRPQDRRVL